MIDFILSYSREIILGTFIVVGVFYAFKYGNEKDCEREDLSI